MIDKEEEIIATTSTKLLLVFNEGKMENEFSSIYEEKIKPILNTISL